MIPVIIVVNPGKSANETSLYQSISSLIVLFKQFKNISIETSADN